MAKRVSPWKVVEGKRYRVYRKWGLPSRAEQLRRALAIAEKAGVHEKFVMFRPGEFTLQIHGWGLKLKMPYLAQLTTLVQEKKIKTRKQVNNKLLNNALEKVKRIALNWKSYDRKIDSALGGKWHWDLRMRKFTAPNWFGVTLFNAPWLGTPEHRVLGTVKGFEKLTPAGKVLRKKEELWAEAHGVKFADIKWMEVDKDVYLPGEKGSLTPRIVPSFIVTLEMKQPLVIHRRDVDFLDGTFLGKKLVGRYFDRLVRREVSEEEKPKYLKGKKVETRQWFWWKSKDQFDLALMKDVATAKTRLVPRRVIEK